MTRFMRVRYVVLLALCLMYFITYVDRVNISVAGPLIKQEMGLNATQLGLVFSAFAYPYAVMQIFGGWLADRFGPRLVLGLLSTVWALGTVLTGTSHAVASVVGTRLIVGLGEGGAFPSATRALTHWMPVTERGFAQGITHSFARLGGAVTPPIVLAIVLWSGWRASFVVLGAASLAWTFVWLWLFRNTPTDHKWVTAQELVEIDVTSRATKGDARGGTPWRLLIRHMWLVTFVDFCYGWSLWVFLTWLPSYLIEARGFPLKQMAIMSMLPLGAGVIGDTLGGVASDFILRRTMNLTLARRTILVGGLSGSLIFIVPVSYTGNALGAVYLLAASFFFLELTNAVLWTLPLDIAGEYAGTAAGMMNTGFGIAGMLSPALFGYLVQVTGSYHVPFGVTAGLLAGGIIGSLFIDPRNQIQGKALLLPV